MNRTTTSEDKSDLNILERIENLEVELDKVQGIVAGSDDTWSLIEVQQIMDRMDLSTDMDQLALTEFPCKLEALLERMDICEGNISIFSQSHMGHTNTDPVEFENMHGFPPRGTAKTDWIKLMNDALDECVERQDAKLKQAKLGRDPTVSVDVDHEDGTPKTSRIRETSYGRTLQLHSIIGDCVPKFCPECGKKLVQIFFDEGNDTLKIWVMAYGELSGPYAHVFKDYKFKVAGFDCYCGNCTWSGKIEPDCLEDIDPIEQNRPWGADSQ